MTRPTGYDIRESFRTTPLGPAVKAVMNALLVYHWDWRAQCIPAGKRPSLTDLQAETGYCRTTIRNALFDLEELGWITRTPPPVELARREHARTAYELHVPDSAAMRQARDEHAGPDHRERRAAMAATLADARRAREAAAAARAAGQPAAAAAAAAAPAPSARPELVELARKTLAAVARGRPVDDELARQAVAAVLDDRAGVDSPRRYLVKAIRSEPDRFFPTPTPPSATGHAAARKSGADRRPSAGRIRDILGQAGATVAPAT